MSLKVALAMAGFVVAASTGVSQAAMTCTASIANVNFGPIDVLANTAFSTFSGVSISCSGGAANTTYRFCGNASKGPDYVTGQRRMSSGANLLNFGLYVDSGRTVPYGNYADPIFGGGYQFDLTTDGSGAIVVNGAMFAGIPANQTTAVPGSYSEQFTTSATNMLQYGALSSAGSCPIGPSSYQTSFTVNATVSAKCTVTAGTLAFGSTPGQITSRVDASGTVTAKCTNTTPYSVGLSSGTNASGAQRRMRLGATSSYVNYDLYTDSGRTNAWSASTSITSATSCSGGANTCVLGTGTGGNQTITIYGSLPVQSAPATGDYSDTVLVTVTY